VLVIASAERADDVRRAVAGLGDVVPFAVDVAGFTVEASTPKEEAGAASS
jgi:hypothetical protein